MDAPEPRRLTPLAGLAAVGCALFVFAALAAEVTAGLYANSPTPRWAERVAPLAWPQPARVLWWLVIGAAAFAYRVILHRAGIRQRAWVVAVSVVPFVVFAAGIAVGADWSTWH